MRRRHVSFSIQAAALIALAALMAACGGDADGESGPVADAGVDGSGGSDGGDAGDPDGGIGGDAGPDLPWPSDPDQAMPLPDIDGSRTLSDLTNVEIEALCVAQELFYRTLERPIQDYLCFADAVDYGQVGQDPTATCDTWRGVCTQQLDLFEQFPDLAPEPTTELCRFVLDQRRAPVCTDPTVDAYRSCLLDNLAQQLPGVEMTSMTCAEAAPLVSIRPTTLNNCACGVPDRIGPTPADDADWDYVLDADDICPGSDTYFPVDAWGCTPLQDRDGDHVFDPDDLCGDTDPDAPEISERGCSRAQDGDFDDVPDVWDPCLDTPEGAELVTPGCSISQDEDADAVPNGSDWCPFTAAGADVSVEGCTPDQGEPWRDPYVDTLPDGSVSVVIGDNAEGAPRLYYLPTGVTQRDADGFDFNGTLLLDLSDNGYLLMPGGAIRFNAPEDLEPGRALSLSGSINLPIPAVGILSGLRFDPLSECTLGYADGDDEVFQQPGLLVEADRGYLYATCRAGFSGQLGNIRFKTPQGAEFIVAMDPADPALFFRSDIDGMGPLSQLRDVSLAVSSTGRLAYEPTETWEVDDVAEAVDAHMYISGAVPVETWLSTDFSDFAIDGQTFIDIDPDDNGLPSLGSPDLAFGANGAFSMTLQINAFRITTELAEASAGGRFGRTNTIWASGVIGADSISLPINFFFDPISQIRAAVVASDQDGLSRFIAEGFFRFRGSDIHLPLIPDLLDVDIEGRVQIDDEALQITGHVGGDFHPWIQVAGGGVDVEIYYAWDDSLFYFDVSGDLRVLDQQVEHIHLGSDDLVVDGDAFFFLEAFR